MQKDSQEFLGIFLRQRGKSRRKIEVERVIILEMQRTGVIHERISALYPHSILHEKMPVLFIRGVGWASASR